MEPTSLVARMKFREYTPDDIRAIDVIKEMRNFDYGEFNELTIPTIGLKGSVWSNWYRKCLKPEMKVPSVGTKRTIKWNWSSMTNMANVRRKQYPPHALHITFFLAGLNCMWQTCFHRGNTPRRSSWMSNSTRTTTPKTKSISSSIRATDYCSCGTKRRSTISLIW